LPFAKNPREEKRTGGPSAVNRTEPEGHGRIAGRFAAARIIPRERLAVLSMAFATP
jgi:hypothetical protein